MGLRTGRPEDIADEIMNQSDEGLDGLLGSEIVDGEYAEEDYGPGESPADDYDSEYEDNDEY